MSLREYFKSDRPLARVINNLAWLLAGKSFGAVLSLFYLALATQLLGPEQFGYFTLILGTAQAISAIVSFQSWQLIIRFGSHNIVTKGAEGARKNNALASYCVALDLAAALVGLLLATGVILAFANRFGWSDDFILSAALFAAVMLLSIKSSAIGLLRLYDRFRDGALAAAVVPLMRLIGALIAWRYAPTVQGFLWAWAIAETASTFAHWAFVRTKTPIRLRQTSWREILDVPHSHSRFYNFAFVTNAGATIKAVAQQVPLLVVGFVVGPAAAGFFRLAYQLKEAASRFADMLGRAVYAEFSALDARGHSEDSSELFSQLRKIAAIGALTLALLTYFAGRPILLLIAGPEFLPAYPILLILAAASAIELFGVGFEPHLMAIGKPLVSLVIRALAALLLVAVMALLLPTLGARGAAYAVLVYSAAAVAMLYLYHRLR